MYTVDHSWRFAGHYKLMIFYVHGTWVIFDVYKGWAYYMTVTFLKFMKELKIADKTCSHFMDEVKAGILRWFFDGQQ